MGGTMGTTELDPLIRQFVVENFMFGEEPEPLDGNASFVDLGIVDSTGVLELVTFIEESFGIRVEDEEIIPENLDSIHRIALFVRDKLALHSGGAVAGR